MVVFSLSKFICIDLVGMDVMVSNEVLGWDH